MAALVDQYTLSQDTTFQNRVRMAIITAAVAVQAEALTTPHHTARATLANAVLRDPPGHAVLFAQGVATDDTVESLAGGPPPLQINVTDTAINNAVTSLWDAYAKRP